MALELDALLVYASELAEGEYLESAAVREDVAVPVAEVMKAVEGLEDLDSGSEIEMVCISENQVVADFGHIIMMDGLDRSVGSHRHKGRGLDHAVREPYLPCSGLA